MERNDLSTFCRGLPKEHFCEIISKSIHWLKEKHRDLSQYMYFIFHNFYDISDYTIDSVIRYIIKK